MHDAVGEALTIRRIEAVMPHVRGRLLDLDAATTSWFAATKTAWGWTFIPARRRPRRSRFVVASVGSGDVRNDHHHRRPQSHAEPRCGAARMPPHFARRRADCRDDADAATSRVWHWLRAPWDADQRERGMKPGEVYGFSPSEMSTSSPRAASRSRRRGDSCSA